MKKCHFILGLFIFLQLTSAVKLCAQNEQNDSSFVEQKQEDQSIEAVIKNRVPPPEKVQYLTQVTKYGFKNLFSKYSYNKAQPYSIQVNPHAESFMQDYLHAHSKSLLKMKGWAQPYFNLIDNILTQYGLPKELKYVAVIESNLKVGATSWVGAAGPWQFMPATARRYGLTVNGSIDERRDYVKSTHSAAKYLLNSYRIYHDWLLVIASYNCGAGNVNKAIRKSGSRNFWSLQYFLPTESRNYVKKFIATHYIMEGAGGITTTSSQGYMQNLAVEDNITNTNSSLGPNHYDLKPSLSEEEANGASEQTISGKFNSLIICKNLSMDIRVFNHYNPNFDAVIGQQGSFDLRLPDDKMNLFQANKYIILNECVQLLLGDNNVPYSQSIYPKSKITKKKK